MINRVRVVHERFAATHFIIGMRGEAHGERSMGTAVFRLIGGIETTGERSFHMDVLEVGVVLPLIDSRVAVERGLAILAHKQAVTLEVGPSHLAFLQEVIELFIHPIYRFANLGLADLNRGHALIEAGNHDVLLVAVVLMCLKSLCRFLSKLLSRLLL